MYTYELTTNVGLIRLNTFQQIDRADPLFQDEEIAALYLQEGSNIKKASARVLEITAQREAFIQKVIKLLSLSTDGAKLAAEFRAQAALLRSQADNEGATAEDTQLFDIAEQVYEPFGYSTHIHNVGLRNG